VFPHRPLQADSLPQARLGLRSDPSRCRTPDEARPFDLTGAEPLVDARPRVAAPLAAAIAPLAQAPPGPVAALLPAEQGARHASVAVVPPPFGMPVSEHLPHPAATQVPPPGREPRDRVAPFLARGAALQMGLARTIGAPAPLTAAIVHGLRERGRPSAGRGVGRRARPRRGRRAPARAQRPLMAPLAEVANPLRRGLLSRLRATRHAGCPWVPADRGRRVAPAVAQAPSPWRPPSCRLSPGCRHRSGLPRSWRGAARIPRLWGTPADPPRPPLERSLGGGFGGVHPIALGMSRHHGASSRGGACRLSGGLRGSRDPLPRGRAVGTAGTGATRGRRAGCDLTPQGLAPCPKRQASLGAPTLACTRCRKRERGTRSGRPQARSAISAFSPSPLRPVRHRFRVTRLSSGHAPPVQDHGSHTPFPGGRTPPVALRPRAGVPHRRLRRPRGDPRTRLP
jgi:hypothetical protein